MKHHSPFRWLSPLVLCMFMGSALLTPAFALDINTATAAELQELKGIGPKRAAAIVSYRDQNGPFKTPEDLLKVKGVGENVLTSNAEQLEFPASNAKAKGSIAIN